MQQLNKMDSHIQELKISGFTVIDTIALGIFTKDEIEKQLHTCSDYIKKFFEDRDLILDIDPTRIYKETSISRTKKNSLEYNACYIQDNGKLNTRNPAISKGCGMGRATSQKEIYYDKYFVSQTEKLRKTFTLLYDSPVCRHLSRFGYKIPSPDSSDMFTHVDMAYVNSDELPPPRKLKDPQSYGPYSNDGRPQRLQGVLCLNESDGGFYCYPGAHLLYKEIGEELDFPKPKNSPQALSKDIIEKFNLERKVIPNKPGLLIVWNCAIPHGNTKVINTTPRVVKYINFQPYKKQVQFPRIVGLGNQGKD